MNQAQTAAKPARVEFYKFWAGQTISHLGSTFTSFALPLLVYSRTESAISLGISSAARFLPYPIFGLLLGALADRLSRKRLMISADLGRALLLVSIPALLALDALPLWWIYLVGFLDATLDILFSAAEFAVVPALVEAEQITTANGRLAASSSAAFIVGPLLAGLLINFIALPTLLLVDALSYLVSAVSIGSIAVSFNSAAPRERKSLRQDIMEGLRYVIRHPVLRNIALMLSLLNLVGTTVFAQSVIYATVQLGASESQLGLLYATGSFGVFMLSLLAGPLRRRWSFGTIALSAMLVEGVMVVCLSRIHSFWLALPFWALFTGSLLLFNINLNSLRQAIVPNHLLGRVVTTGRLLASGATPIGSLLGGLAVERTGDIGLVYAVIGLIIVVTTVAFSFSALGHTDRYLQTE